MQHMRESKSDRLLAFIDVETTGLNPAVDRIAEIGIVFVDGGVVEHWTTLVKTSPTRDARFSSDLDALELRAMATFGELAIEVAGRLAGRLLVAHNARFDHAFLRAEFARARIDFSPQVLCSVMLSRKLSPHLPHHDLDSLIEHYGLRAQTRHRALPDADLVWQWWQAIHERHQVETIEKAIEALLAGPILPADLDPLLIERLPEAPGAFALMDENDRPLAAGAACNLKAHVLGYFRIDHASSKALECAHRVAGIKWRPTSGLVGARLHAAVFLRLFLPAAEQGRNEARFTWRLAPDKIPLIGLIPLPRRFVSAEGASQCFGIFSSERKARNALDRVAAKHRLCRSLLGITGPSAECAACAAERSGCPYGSAIARKRQLLQLFGAIRSLAICPWPHCGPIGIRERGDLHLVDDWQFLGTARSESEIQDLLQQKRADFDPRMYLRLKWMLSRLAPTAIVDLSRYAGESLGEHDGTMRRSQCRLWEVVEDQCK
jgi:DNA polymerase-3 subunit epsilon